LSPNPPFRGVDTLFTAYRVLLYSITELIMILCCGGSVLFSFWLVFSVISGW